MPGIGQAKIIWIDVGRELLMRMYYIKIFSMKKTLIFSRISFFFPTKNSLQVTEASKQLGCISCWQLKLTSSTKHYFHMNVEHESQGYGDFSPKVLQESQRPMRSGNKRWIQVSHIEVLRDLCVSYEEEIQVTVRTTGCWRCQTHLLRKSSNRHWKLPRQKGYKGCKFKCHIAGADHTH